MTVPTELPGDVFGAEVDPDAIDRLLAVPIHPEEVPVRYRAVARTLRALTSPPSEDELSRESVAVRQAVVLLDRAPTVADRAASRRPARARIAALVVAGTMVASAGAAVANVLPEPLEDPIADALSHLGISVRPPHEGPPEPAPTPEPRASGSTLRWSMPTGRPTTSPRATGGGGAAVSSAASDGKSRADQHPTGQPDDHSAPARHHGPPDHANAGGNDVSGPPDGHGHESDRPAASADGHGHESDRPAASADGHGHEGDRPAASANGASTAAANRGSH
jgi:hypothetical protein